MMFVTNLFSQILMRIWHNIEREKGKKIIDDLKWIFSLNDLIENAEVALSS